MNSVPEILETFTASDYEEVQSLAAANIGPTDIARTLGAHVRAFKKLWSDPDSQLRKAYDLGRLEIRTTKMQQLTEKAKDGGITAIQQHEKYAREQEFQDIKSKVFDL